MPYAENNILDIKRFFNTEEHPVTPQEMGEFWLSLTNEEKDYYRNADLG